MPPPQLSVHFVSASDIDLVYDDSDRDMFTFSQSSTRGWTVYPDLQWLGGTATVLGGDVGSTSSDGELLTVTYRGGGISLYGLAPSAAEGQRFRVSVNGEDLVEASFGGTLSPSSPSPPSSSNSTSNSTVFSYGPWFNLQTPESSISSSTTLKFYDLPSGLSLDYAKLAANKATQTLTVPVIVDDTDPQIAYSGSWTQNQDPFTLAGKPNTSSQAYAYGGGVHVGSQVGDTVLLSFQGTSIKVFGLLAPGVQEMTVSYTVDNFPAQVRRYGSAGAGAASAGMESISMQNYELFSSGGILGDKYHSLLVNVTSIQAAAGAQQQPGLTIDYFTYEPRFELYDDQQGYSAAMAFDSGKTFPKYIWIIIAVFVALGVVLVVGSCIRIFVKRRPDVVKRMAQTVRLDLELSFYNARRFLRSTILDIRAPTPPPPPSPGSASPSGGSLGPGEDNGTLPQPQNRGAEPQNHQQVQELWNIIAYLSRINARLVAAVGGSGRSMGTGSFGSRSFGSRSGGSGRVQEESDPPPYRA